jgi:hypothetical protein
VSVPIPTFCPKEKPDAVRNKARKGIFFFILKLFLFYIFNKTSDGLC